MIDADTPALRAILQEIVDLVLISGGKIHPGALLRERGGYFSVHANRRAVDPEVPLFILPSDLLIPTSSVRWGTRDDVLTGQIEPPDGLTPIQRRLLDLHLALYNAADKAKWARSNLPILALSNYPAIFAAIQALRPNFSIKVRSTTEEFIQTRVFRYRSPTAAAQDKGERVIMPLIDLLNHHPKGAPYVTDSLGLRIALAQLEPDGECFANYGGRRDVLDTALHYGFLELNTPWARSAPLEVEVTGIGSVLINSERRRPFHPLDPPEVIFTENGVTLSHLGFNRRHPDRLRTMLGLALLGAARRRGLDSKSADHAVENGFMAIRRANLTLLNNLYRVATSGLCELPLATLLAQAAQIQCEIIDLVLGSTNSP